MSNSEDLKKIRKYCNHHMYTDVDPYEVVRVISDKCVEVRKMDTKLIQAPKDFHPGGFVGHYSDNHAQEYEYIINPDNPVTRVRWSERNRQWQKGKHTRFHMADKPWKFYDYNF